jgi:hypothetical protein
MSPAPRHDVYVRVLVVEDHIALANRITIRLPRRDMT